MSITVLMILFYAGFYFVPIIPSQKIPKQSSYNFSEIDGICDRQLTVRIFFLIHLYHLKKKFVNYYYSIL